MLGNEVAHALLADQTVLLPVKFTIAYL